MADNEKQWVCVVCGYVYDGDTPFEELPDDWTCPVCGVDKSFFELRLTKSPPARKGIYFCTARRRREKKGSAPNSR